MKHQLEGLWHSPQEGSLEGSLGYLHLPKGRPGCPLPLLLAGLRVPVPRAPPIRLPLGLQRVTVWTRPRSWGPSCCPQNARKGVEQWGLPA